MGLVPLVHANVTSFNSKAPLRWVLPVIASWARRHRSSKLGLLTILDEIGHVEGAMAVDNFNDVRNS